MSQQVETGTVSVSVRHLGGIDSAQITVEPGIAALTGRNATNRTSMLRAIAAALGGSDASLKVDADEGAVELDLGPETYRRQYRRENGDVRVTGEPYSEDAVLVDTFASLLKSNPVRRAVERGDGEGLRDVVMAPVDTAHLRERIEAVQRELQSTGDRLGAIERDRDRLPTLERRRAELQEELAAVSDEIADARTAVEDREADPDAAEAAEAVVETLHEVRGELEASRDELDTQRRAIRALEAERDEVQADLEALSVPEAELESIEEELRQLRARDRRLEHSINSLLSIIEFNEGLVSGEAEPPAGRPDGTEVLAGLDPDSETVECWTCGHGVPRRDIVEQLDDLRELATERRSERSTLADRIERRRDEQREYETAVEREQELERRLESIDREITDRTGRLEDLRARQETLVDRIEDLEAEAAETEGLRDSDLLEQYQRLSELEYERGRLEREVGAVEDEIGELEALEHERRDLEEHREELRAELASLRTRIEDLERSVVETFNEHAATMIDLLGYDNIERVWIERKANNDTGGPGVESTFDLHVVRSADGGTVLEDTVEHLSESERELVGLTVALAGYLAHDVHETVPFMLLDSLEAIDAERIAALVDHFADYVPYLVVALLPEDAAALEDSAVRIDMAA